MCEIYLIQIFLLNFKGSMILTLKRTSNNIWAEDAIILGLYLSVPGYINWQTRQADLRFIWNQKLLVTEYNKR